MRQAGSGYQGVGLTLAEHERGQLEPRSQAVAHARLAFDGHALVLQVGHVAVDGALRDLESLGQEGGGGQAPPADELHDLEQAVSAAHVLSKNRL